MECHISDMLHKFQFVVIKYFNTPIDLNTNEHMPKKEKQKNVLGCHSTAVGTQVKTCSSSPYSIVTFPY
jgi:hypothetical protein